MAVGLAADHRMPGIHRSPEAFRSPETGDCRDYRREFERPARSEHPTVQDRKTSRPTAAEFEPPPRSTSHATWSTRFCSAGFRDERVDGSHDTGQGNDMHTQVVGSYVHVPAGESLSSSWPRLHERRSAASLVLGQRARH